MGSRRQATRLIGDHTTNTEKMMNKVVLLLAVVGLASCLEIEIGRDSNVYPLFLNPFDVTHWKCLGWTVYENTDKSALYTYDVDVCFAAVVAAKLGFPWIYEYFTGRNFFQTIGLAASGQDYSSYDYDYNTEHLQSTSSFSEKASELFQEMGKVQDSFIHRDPSPYHKYNRNQAQY